MKKEEAKLLLRKIVRNARKICYKNGWSSGWIMEVALNFRFQERSWNYIAKDISKSPSYIRDRAIKALELAYDCKEIDNSKIDILKMFHLKMRR